METIRTRATDSLPSVLLTLLGMIQAIALEVLWSRAMTAEHLKVAVRGWSQVAVTGWLQVASVFLGIVVIWLLYVSLVMRFRWLPSTRDSILPFVIGVGEFLLAERLEPEHLHWWLYAMAALFAVAAYTSWTSFQAARRHPDNREIFQTFVESRWESVGRPLLSVAVIALLGAAVQATGPGSLVGLAAVAITLGALAVQLQRLHAWWVLTVHAEGEPGDVPTA